MNSGEALEKLASTPLSAALPIITKWALEGSAYVNAQEKPNPDDDLDPTGSVLASGLFTSRCLEILFHSVFSGNSTGSDGSTAESLPSMLNDCLRAVLACGLQGLSSTTSAAAAASGEAAAVLPSQVSPLITAIDEAANSATQNILSLRSTLQAAVSLFSTSTASTNSAVGEGNISAVELALPLAVSCAKLVVSLRKAICVLNRKALLDDRERQALADLVKVEEHAKAGMPMLPVPPSQPSVSASFSPRRGGGGGGAGAMPSPTSSSSSVSAPAALVDMTSLVEFYGEAHSVVEALGAIDYNAPNAGADKMFHSALDIVHEATQSTTPLVAAVVSKMQSALPSSPSSPQATRHASAVNPEIAVKKAQDELRAAREKLSSVILPIQSRYTSSRDRRLALEAERNALMAKLAAVEEEIESVSGKEAAAEEQLREALSIHQPIVEQAARKERLAEEAALKINAAPFVSKAINSVSTSFTHSVKSAAEAIESAKKANDKVSKDKVSTLSTASSVPSPYLRAMIAYLKLQALLLTNLIKRASVNRQQAIQLSETEKQLTQIGGMVREAKEARDKARDALEKALQDEDSIRSLRQQSSILVRTGVKQRYSPTVLATFQRMSPFEQGTLHIIRALATGLGLDADLCEQQDGSAGGGGGGGGWEMFSLPSNADSTLHSEVANARQCLKSAVGSSNVPLLTASTATVAAASPAVAPVPPKASSVTPASPAASQKASAKTSSTIASPAASSSSSTVSSPRRPAPSASKEKKEPVVIDRRTTSASKSTAVPTPSSAAASASISGAAVGGGGVGAGSAKKSSPWGAVASSPMRVPFPKDLDSSPSDGISWGDQVLDSDKKAESTSVEKQ
jgi:hypothetical protein